MNPSHAFVLGTVGLEVHLEIWPRFEGVSALRLMG